MRTNKKKGRCSILAPQSQLLRGRNWTKIINKIMTELKDGHWFAVDNKFIDSYASHFSPATIAVYVAILRFRFGSTDRARISQDSLSKKLGISREAVGRVLKTLVAHSLLRVEKIKRNNGTWSYNEYLVIDEKYWLPPCDPISHGVELRPCDICAKNHETYHHTKKTKYKKTNKYRNDFLLENRRELAAGFKMGKRNTGYG
ncbi:MAG: hypothetical protein UU88_C0001G0090 [Parcubacteria group bacterium GW2011_GWC1_42_11]|uniref:Helix-turn-helix domain-containing protein n=1 Tax=Candidatus Nomurabacteria bacterium GW2011_GWC2_42_20 TaxID=1618756 RepID=A0A0G0ZFV8_9BACT|nr:MAG: hypothetical protein UU88_C0001G0090 [Parcubacteria group bacterium GW2011_GWC1_42_11]KKS47605.1 MAG: hypothetical protein UV12_C0006G0029 [Candidatus Nomurabacteria bacterium GW2011_GWC2_42_20]KKT09531.1 MAG: hypothetical protein UV86_C0005G0002 [Candidatus Nomurabacteria bacterium GW2011_GWB1_43_20]